MTVPMEAVEAIVRLSMLSKAETFWLINEWQPDVTDEDLEAIWSKRRLVQ